MEPSVILQISKGDLWYLYTNFPKFEIISVLLLRINILSFKTDYFSLFATAYERYENFLKQYPNLSNRVPNTQIASYLGITPEFLSKIIK